LSSITTMSAQGRAADGVGVRRGFAERQHGDGDVVSVEP